MQELGGTRPTRPTRTEPSPLARILASFGASEVPLLATSDAAVCADTADLHCLDSVPTEPDETRNAGAGRPPAPPAPPEPPASPSASSDAPPVPSGVVMVLMATGRIEKFDARAIPPEATYWCHEDDSQWMPLPQRGSK